MLKPGDTLDAWVVERPLGAGGMGSVYLCHNRGAKRILAAVKVLDARLDGSAKVRARFVREAELLFALDHPNIVKVRNVRMDAAPPYLEMEFVAGQSLDALLQEGPVSPGDAARIAAQIADALAYVHGRGVFHRDVKPSNIVVQADGTAKLVDFGIAAEAGRHTVSEAGQAIGSAVYIPPEWLAGGTEPASWDAYALGVVLYELLTAVNAFPAPTTGSPMQQFVATLAAKQGRGPLDVADAPEALRALVRALTTPDAAARRLDLAVVAQELRALDLAADPDFARRLAPLTAVSGATGETWSGASLEASLGGAGGAVADMPTRPLPPPGPGTTSLPALSSLSRRVGALLVSGALLAGAAWMFLRGSDTTEAPREVVLTSPLSADELVVRLDGATVAPSGDGRWGAGSLRAGTHRVEVRRGAGCGVDPAPAWCGVRELALDVVAGDGVLEHALDAPNPARREVVVTDAGGGLLSLAVGDRVKAEAPRGAVRVELLPGKHPASATGVGCPPPPCGEACPATCARWEGELVVPWGRGTHAVSLTLATGAATSVDGASATEVPGAVKPVAGVSVQAKPAGAVTAQEPAAPEGPRTAGAGVTNVQLAIWLGANAAWQPDAARSAGQADAELLAGWVGVTPPSSGPVLATSPALAQAYCATRGGIARVGDLPTTWDMATAAWHEWRLGADGQIVSLRSDGQVLPAGPRTRTGKYNGIRCAR